MPKISIITINLNNKAGLEKTLKGTVSQTFNDFELIVIDGGSTDGSAEIINLFKTNITYAVSEPDSGIYNAMNKGILQAKGEYCFFLNSGDFFVTNTVLNDVFFSNVSEDIVFGNMLVCMYEKVVGKCLGKESLTFYDIYASTIKHQSTFIKRKLFTTFGLYNENLKIIADWEFFIKSIGFGGATYKYLNVDISYFDNNGLSNNSSKKVIEERKIVVDNWIPKLMQADYEFLIDFKKYEITTKNKISFFLLRLLTKMVKIIGRY